MLQLQSWECVPQVQEVEEARVAGAKWESIGLQEKRPETSAGETMEGLRAIAGVWLPLFMSGQYWRVLSRVRVLFDLRFESIPLTTILAMKG